MAAQQMSQHYRSPGGARRFPLHLQSLQTKGARSEAAQASSSQTSTYIRLAEFSQCFASKRCTPNSSYADCSNTCSTAYCLYLDTAGSSTYAASYQRVNYPSITVRVSIDSAFDEWAKPFPSRSGSWATRDPEIRSCVWITISSYQRKFPYGHCTPILSWPKWFSKWLPELVPSTISKSTGTSQPAQPLCSPLASIKRRSIRRLISGQVIIQPFLWRQLQRQLQPARLICRSRRSYPTPLSHQALPRPLPTAYKRKHHAKYL